MYNMDNSSLNRVLESSEELAIDIRNAVFQYKTGDIVLKNLCLQVPKGKIFALLGPNGTGKTTLIRLILGCLQLKSGSIQVFGVRPGSKYSDIPGKGVGYMPQDLALFEEFTIKEILNFYGAIYHIKGLELKKRKKHLMSMLNLPEKGRLINMLSGGQKRRVSLAVSLLHTPKLIILDEPTAGVDSILRERIWQYLEEICINKDHTVLITTHYIEEAKSAANIAFLNYGTVLKQSNPQKLLQQYGCQTLETVFLSLCLQIKNGEEFNDNIQEAIETNTDVQGEPDKVIKDNYKNTDKYFDYERVRVMIWKYYTLSKRKPIFLFLFFLLPILTLTTINLALAQSPRHIPIVIYNMDQNPKYSQILIDSIDRQFIDLNFSDNNETAFQSVVDGKNYMSIVFGQNFSDSFQYIVKDYLKLTEEDFEDSRIRIYADLSNPSIGSVLFKVILQAFNKLLNKMSSELGINAEQYFHLVSAETPIYGKYELSLADIIGPGVVIAMCHCLPIVITSLQIVYDRKNSSLERILVSGLKPMEIFAAHLFENIVLIGVQLILTLFTSFVVYQNTQIGNYFSVYSLLFLTGIQGMFIGFLIGLIMTDEVEMFGAVIVILYPTWFISGVFWPIEAIPYIFRNLIQFSPLTQPLKAFTAIMLRGWTLSHPVVYWGFIVNFIYIIFLLIIDSILFLKLKK